MNEYNLQDRRGNYDEHKEPLFYQFEGSIEEIEIPQSNNSQLVKLVSTKE